MWNNFDLQNLLARKTHRSEVNERSFTFERDLHTCGTETITLNISEVSLLWGLNSKRKEKVSLLERCAHFRGR